MRKVKFNKNGLLISENPVSLTLDDLERIFVLHRDDRVHRAKLYKRYLEHTRIKLTFNE